MCLQYAAIKCTSQLKDFTIGGRRFIAKSKMQALGQILHSLGIDSSLLYQLALCMLLYWLLTRYVFSLFFAAHQKRQQQTTGNEDVVASLNQRFEQTSQKYQQLARELNTESHQIFSAQQAQAGRECARILNEAKNKAQLQLERGQARLEQQAHSAQSQLDKEATQLAQPLVQKLTQSV